MPFRVGPTELIIILVVVMIIFGVGRLPEIGGAMGKAIREFRSTVSGTKGDDSEDQETVESGTESGKKN
ncbi:MAG: twin-arginine translocase TatA/TatE family subunit [SAR202 cluster bacterium]|nr:twin-arginine translocase TatA/TatE family subunit [SAR202 cluster bacterium]